MLEKINAKIKELDETYFRMCLRNCPLTMKCNISPSNKKCFYHKQIKEIEKEMIKAFREKKALEVLK